MTGESSDYLESQVVAALQAQGFHSIVSAGRAGNGRALLRCSLCQLWELASPRGKRSLSFELELIVGCWGTDGPPPNVGCSRGTPMAVDSRFASRIATALGRRLLLSLGGLEVGQLELLELPGPDRVPVILRPRTARPEPVEDMVRELVAAARGCVIDDVVAGVHACRLVFPVLVLPNAFIECSHLRSGALTMTERDEATLAWPDPAMAPGEQALVQLVRDRVFSSYVARARAAFEHLRRHHRRNMERALAAVGDS